MVYNLYELTCEEVKIIDPAFALTEKEYLSGDLSTKSILNEGGSR